MDSELLYYIGLQILKGVGPVNAKLLLSYCGSAKTVFTANEEELLQIPQIGQITVNQIIHSRDVALQRAKEELFYIEKNNIQVLPYNHDEFPNRLKYCDDGPALLFYQGTANLNATKIVTIVGTRRMTDYGKRLIKDLLYEMQGMELVVVSGLAYGVDTAVHKACVEYNIPTIGVLAHGLDRIYPARNHSLANSMKQKGGLLTEFLTKTNPDRENFPKRNRIVAGLSDATIVVESDVKGGSLITADIAFSYDRDVMAFPGSVNQQFSGGCNNLIKYNKASLIENAGDVFRLLGWEKTGEEKKNRQRQLFLDLGEVEQKLVKLLMKESLSAHLLSVKSSIPLPLVQTHLLNLELKGVVRIAPGNRYTLN